MRLAAGRKLAATDVDDVGACHQRRRDGSSEIELRTRPEGMVVLRSEDRQQQAAASRRHAAARAHCAGRIPSWRHGSHVGWQSPGRLSRTRVRASVPGELAQGSHAQHRPGHRGSPRKYADRPRLHATASRVQQPEASACRFSPDRVAAVTHHRSAFLAHLTAPSVISVGTLVKADNAITGRRAHRPIDRGCNSLGVRCGPNHRCDARGQFHRKVLLVGRRANWAFCADYISAKLLPTSAFRQIRQG